MGESNDASTFLDDAFQAETDRFRDYFGIPLFLFF